MLAHVVASVQLCNKNLFNHFGILLITLAVMSGVLLLLSFTSASGSNVNLEPGTLMGYYIRYYGLLQSTKCLFREVH